MMIILIMTLNTSPMPPVPGWRRRWIAKEVVGRYTSLAVDSQDKVHISYSDDTNDDLKYITNATGSWVAETLDSMECRLEYLPGG